MPLPTVMVNLNLLLICAATLATGQASTAAGKTTTGQTSRSLRWHDFATRNSQNAATVPTCSPQIHRPLRLAGAASPIRDGRATHGGNGRLDGVLDHAGL